MGPRRHAPPKTAPVTGRGNKKKVEKEKPKAWLRPSSDMQTHQDNPPVDLSASVPLPLQQLLLDVLKFALLFPSSDQPGAGRKDSSQNRVPVSVQHPDALECSSAELNLKSLIQTIKSHLYNRDFNSAFVDAKEDLLRAYSLRWSATRALGYAGILKGVCNTIFDRRGSECSTLEKNQATNRIVCIGGGGGAEIIALAAVWRDMLASWNHQAKDIASLQAGVADLSLKCNTKSGASEEEAPIKQSEGLNQYAQQGEYETASRDISDAGHDENPKQTPLRFPNLSVIAVDIANWSAIVERLTKAIQSPSVPGPKSHPAPLLPSAGSRDQDQGGGFDISFRRFDVLSCQNDEDMKLLLCGASFPSHGDNHEDVLHEKTVLITLMFTVNELFSTSMAKTTVFLLKITEWAEPGMILLVVDSPGSYSTVSLTRKAKPDSATVDERANDVTMKEQPQLQQQQKTYPMKFLLDHTLMSVAAGKWQRMVTEDSRWFRRDTSKLRYNVGEGAGLEDMRFQIHIYRRLEC